MKLKIQDKVLKKNGALSKMGSCESIQSLFRKRLRETGQIVDTGCGSVEGFKLTTDNGKYDVWLGIPYAEPPIGNLRFQKPKPKEAWTGVRKCKRFGNRSVQRDMFWDTFNCIGPQNEDCLYLNVFAPELDPMKTYPVMFYIHGGGFMMDSALRYTPKNVCRNLCAKGIIVVTIHYRLGYLGFFSTGDSASPGNYGLHDQIEALKWVKQNIDKFGGDPENITVAGQSAGGVSADLLSLSPLSRDLFKNKIVFGANSFCTWAVTTPEACRSYCKRKAKRLGWTANYQFADQYEESRSLLDFMKKVPASKLGTHMIGNKLIQTDCVLPLAPIIGDEALPKPLDELRKEAPEKPSICGVGEEESLLFISIYLMKNNEKELEQHITNLSRRTDRSPDEVRKQLQKIYADSPQLRGSKKQLKRMIVTLLSDISSNHAAYLYMRYHSQGKEPCYAYSFDYSSKNTWGWLSAVVPFTAGTHTSEITYLFDCNYFSSPLSMNDTDRKVSDITSSYITQFVKTGCPNNSILPDWKPVDPNRDLQCMSIAEMPQMKTKSFVNRMAQFYDYWEETEAKLKEERYKQLTMRRVSSTPTEAIGNV